ncbi:MAG: flagellar motor protein MotB, partial [Paraburkholderia sp.]
MALASERHNPKLDDDAEARPERWLLSYSDLVTTLMVLFLALYAIQLAKYHELEIKLLETARSVRNDKAPAAVAAHNVAGSSAGNSAGNLAGNLASNAAG